MSILFLKLNYNIISNPQSILWWCREAKLLKATESLSKKTFFPVPQNTQKYNSVEPMYGQVVQH